MSELNRDMSPAMKAGYARALMDLREVGARLLFEGPRLGGSCEPVPMNRLMLERGRVLLQAADALDHTLT